jgi:hypothetical protein
MEVSPVGTSTVVDVQSSGVSWAAITAGAVATAALSLLLLAFGAGIGLSSISPWAGSGVSATTFKIGSGAAAAATREYGETHSAVPGAVVFSSAAALVASVTTSKTTLQGKAARLVPKVVPQYS